MPSSGDNETSVSVIPLVAEDISVSRVQKPGSTVSVRTFTSEQERLVDETLFHERAQVEHVPVGRVVEQVPPVREEGDTTIIPIVEERITILRTLFLKEEVHVKRVRVAEQHRESVTVRVQEAVVKRTEADAAKD